MLKNILVVLLSFPIKVIAKSVKKDKQTEYY